ncbi:MAG: D-glycerate dehydrogenase [Bacteroidetes bacterium]|nr:D-glycerate dehydrogenase [Bacteroidota bacterium]MCH8525091.1 D-glycerate dehydrogenase [Balneolales bacterium]
MPKRVLITEPIPGKAEAYLKSAGFEVTVGTRKEFDEEQALKAALNEFDGAITMLSNPVNKTVLKENPQLKIVANYAVGYNNIDVEAARSLGIHIANTPDVLSEATADIALLLLLATSRKIREAEDQLRQGEFDGWHPLGFLGTELHGKTAGIVGMGRIGGAIARRLRGFSINVLYHNRNRVNESVEQQTEATYCAEIDDMLPMCDFLFLSSPLTPQTHHIINETRLHLLKSESIIINTGRGPLIDEEALASALISGKIAGAGLDVFEKEPEIHPSLLKAPNTVLLPHIGSATRETREAMGMMAAKAVATVLNEEDIRDLPNIVV